MTISNAVKICGGKFYKGKGRPKSENNADGNARSECITIDKLTEYLDQSGIRVRYNMINRDVDITGLDPKYSSEHIQETLPIILHDELKLIYTGCTKNYITDYLDVIATTNRYNPVLNMLEENTWDGEDRLPGLYQILGINDNDKLSKTLIYKWLWQCLSMPRNELDNNPYGADGMLVLTGKQGIKKPVSLECLL